LLRLGVEPESLSPASANRSKVCGDGDASVGDGISNGLQPATLAVGHLFQNRYKSILCEVEPYFLELVRYIHLNPLRAGLVKNLEGLDTYPYAGHSALMGKRGNGFQEIDSVLAWIGRQAGAARGRYRDFAEKGIELGKRPNLTGGGLVRSTGRWVEVKALRKAEAYMKGDEDFGQCRFCQRCVGQGSGEYDRRNRLASRGMPVDDVAGSTGRKFTAKKTKHRK
jgi:putative transposase